MVHMFKCIIEERAEIGNEVETREKLDSAEKIELERIQTKQTFEKMFQGALVENVANKPKNIPEKLKRGFRTQIPLTIVDLQNLLENL